MRQSHLASWRRTPAKVAKRIQTSADAAFFDSRFFDQYAGGLIRNPEVAIVELVANAWDAGATSVWIVWPSNPNEEDCEFSIEDNGIGMSESEFSKRWKTFSYNRLQTQGAKVEFTDDVKNPPVRYAFGCNGKGRHSMFFFNDHYYLETWQRGQGVQYYVSKHGTGNQPWTVGEAKKIKRAGHGTKLFTKPRLIPFSDESLRTLIGTKFLTDPTFKVFVNNTAVTFEDVGEFVSSVNIDVLGYGSIEVLKVQSRRGRTTKQHGVAWWVRKRLVGKPSWEGIDGALLDGRSNTAKSVTFIVRADILNPAEDVTEDWEGLQQNERTDAVRSSVLGYASHLLKEEAREARNKAKLAILTENQKEIKRLPRLSQEKVATFVEQVATTCPTISERDLSNAAQLLIRLEECASGYELLEKLAMLRPDDLDSWNQVLEEWTVHDAKVVLDELKRRLDVIGKLEELVEKATSDELHQLQPLFEKALWIFGPEYESIEFMSNKQLATIIRELCGGGISTMPKCRPDFVALPDSSIGVYARNSYHEATGEVSGFAKVVILELKRGGFRIADKEKIQAFGYAQQLRNGGKVKKTTMITAFVLGAEIDPGAEEVFKSGEHTFIYPKTYESVIRQAQARTFNLQRCLTGSLALKYTDAELEQVMQPSEFFDIPSEEAEPVTAK